MGTMYAIHNTVRGRHNRTQRAAAPAHFRFQQRVGAAQTRLVRGRLLMVTEEALLRDLEELKKKQKAGILEVRTLDGRVLDLETMQPAPLPATTPLPNPPLDSAANDKPAGQPMPQFPGGQPVQSLPEYSSEEDMVPGESVEIPSDFLPDPEPGTSAGKVVDSPKTERRSEKREKGKAR